MDAAHLHLLLNHFPVLGTLFGLCLLIFGVIREIKILEQAGLVTFVIITLITIPTFLTGEEAEEIVEHLPGISEHYIEEHEELAEIALWLMSITGVLALLTLIAATIKGYKINLLKIITLLFGLATFGLMTVVGNYGGKIRHSELREDSIMQNDTPSEQDEHEKYREHDEDENGD